ncbi:bifunctional glycosyltransferase/CDP-glycerol:glycerophosphate glycerophosphotransferase [Staphylococcus auricularis]
MKKLSLIVPYYNNQENIQLCLESILQQTERDFELILINDGSTDNSEQIVATLLKQYDQPNIHIKLDDNYGHAVARNKGLEQVTTPYLMFVDADDILAPYSVEFYLAHIEHQDALVAPISTFSTDRPETLDTSEVLVHTLTSTAETQYLLRDETVCNIVLKTSIIKGHHLQFDTCLAIFIDQPFMLQYLKYVERFKYVEGAHFYYRGEVIYPFENPNLSMKDFDTQFKDYGTSFFRSLKLASQSVHRMILKKRMVHLLMDAFNPSLEDIKVRYDQHFPLLQAVVKSTLRQILQTKRPLFIASMLLVYCGRPQMVKRFSTLRYVVKHVKRLIIGGKGKALSKYQLYDRDAKVEPHTIVFESFNGKNYSDSPKYIYEYMMHHYPQFHYIWVFKDHLKHEVPGPVTKVLKGSDAYYKAYATASHWITNARLAPTLNKKDNQTYYQTWHGTPLKRLAGDMTHVRMPGTTTAQYKINFRKETARWDYLISPNRYSTEIFQSAFWMEPERILETGYPRNDVIVNHQHDTGYIQHIKANLNIPLGKKVIMYAPTWRDDEYIEKGKYAFQLKIDLADMYEQLGDDTVLLLRMHYLIAEQLDLTGYEHFAYDVSEYDDVSELFLISDALITDYSSVMFDYGILQRPQFFFAYDLEKYDEALRGFYMDYLHELPGPIIKDAHTLTQQLKDLTQIEATYKDQIKAFADRFCHLEQGTAAKQIGDRIAREILGDEAVSNPPS